MAKIKLQQMFAGISGKLNGSVFSSNRSGAYVRSNARPTNAQTAAQVTARNLLATYAQKWKTLTEEQRLAWTNAAPQYTQSNFFKDGETPTGNVLFTKLNINTSIAGGSELTTPPLKVPATQISDFTIEAAEVASTLTIGLTPSSVPVGMALQVDATACLSAGISNAKSKFRTIAVLPSGTDLTESLLSQYEAKFGSLVAGQKLFVRVKMINKTSGDVSLPLTASIIVTA
jgi:hypothetical protein